MDTKQDQVETVTTEAPVPENSSSEEIREGIRGTRRGMDETLDEIGERLHPRHLLDDIFDLFRGGERASNSQLARTSKDVGRAVSHAVREHPLPALLVGAGIAWWIVDAVSDGEENRAHEDQSYWERSRRGASATSRKGANWQFDPYAGRTRSTDYTPLMAQEAEQSNAGEKSSVEK